MGMNLRIELDSNDLGQAVDGLEVRAKQWEDTANYMRTGKSPHEFFVPEDCKDAEEAEAIAQRYRDIICQITQQIAKQARK